MKTEAALAAQAIRNELKALGIQARVKSRNFSMGNAVDIYVTDLPPFLSAKVKAIGDKYQYGHFDGMTDCYEHSNSREDIPQAKFVHVNNQISDEMREAVYQHLRTQWVGGEALPVSYAEGRDLSFHGVYVSQFVRQEFCRENGSFWQERNAA
jgi:hypothetical protein